MTSGLLHTAASLGGVGARAERTNLHRDATSRDASRVQHAFVCNFQARFTDASSFASLNEPVNALKFIVVLVVTVSLVFFFRTIVFKSTN